MSKVAVIVTISQALESIISAVNHGVDFYRQTVAFMDSMEIEGGLSGAQKKAAVLAKMKEIILGKNEDWERWQLGLAGFIDLAKNTFNQFRGLFKAA